MKYSMNNWVFITECVIAEAGHFSAEFHWEKPMRTHQGFVLAKFISDIIPYKEGTTPWLARVASKEIALGEYWHIPWMLWPWYWTKNKEASFARNY